MVGDNGSGGCVGGLNYEEDEEEKGAVLHEKVEEEGALDDDSSTSHDCTICEESKEHLNSTQSPTCLYFVHDKCLRGRI